MADIVDEIPALQDCAVGLLVGYNCSQALAPRRIINGKDREPYAQKTDLGWSIVGCSTPHYPEDAHSLTHRTAVREMPAVTPADAIRMLGSDFADAHHDDKRISQDDILFLQMMEEGIQQKEDGHYEMPLPFKKRPVLPDNRMLAVCRLRHLKKKLDRDQTYREHYKKFMSEVIDSGEAERASSTSEVGDTWYIPHHGVYNLQKPDKIRVVFDCSARYGGTCLNEHLLTGPDLTNDLTGVLLRFRQHPVALMCDVRKMFHRFRVVEQDRNFLRFMWWEDGDTTRGILDYRMKVHLFGAASSPGCANYGLKHLAGQHEAEYPMAAKFIDRHLYVDDGVISVEDAQTATSLVNEVRELCDKGRLQLHKFVSNNRAVIDSIPSSERAVGIKDLDLAFEELPMERALGVQWCVESDRFKFRVVLKDTPLTRRGILSTIASLYDPLGFVAPFVLNGKHILQEMCKQGSGWDEPLAEDVRPRWEHWRNDLVGLGEMDIPRCYQAPGFGMTKKVELHHFSDASSSGYGQCSYIRLVNDKNTVHCSLVIGKSRVAPLKVTTIPRLELTAAVVSAKVSKVLVEELEYDHVQHFFWTDSEIVLGYIRNEARRFHTFVSNRVQCIHDCTDPSQWRHVSSNDNPPGDYASRGLTANELRNSNWFLGPPFLWEQEITIKEDITCGIRIGDPELRKVRPLATKTSERFSLLNRLSRFSDWTKAIRAIARLRRLVQRTNPGGGLTTVEERRDAELFIIKDMQQDVYSEEIEMICQNKSELNSTNRLRGLSPFIDESGILRVGGRLQRSSLSFQEKHPIIMPRDNHITTMVIAYHHAKVQHQGRGMTLNEIRSSGRWIVGCSKAVSNYIHKCVKCRRMRRRVEEQRMANLPEERVEPSPPFTFCGMDCFGPFRVKEGRKEHKRYGLLFTCMSSRAIHIEILDDMTTDSFIDALRCCIAIRGTIAQLRSDQGTNFVGAKNELKQALRELDQERIKVFLAERHCDFVTNPPHASHFSGVWERQIRTIRSVLTSILDKFPTRLDSSSLRTFLYEAMAIVNGRPLTVESLSDHTSPLPLTPNHLLTMKSKVPLPPPGKFVTEDVFARKRWRRVQFLAEQFWSRWRKEYLLNLNARQKWQVPKRNLLPDDVVIISDDDAARSEWQLARVIEAKEDADGLVRKVKLRVRTSVIERPVQKLVLLLERVDG